MVQLHTNKQETSPFGFEAYLPNHNLTLDCVKIVSVAQRMPEVAGVHQADHGGGTGATGLDDRGKPSADRRGDARQHERA